jgi:cytochrome P450
MLSDLSALQHIFNNSYTFIRQSQEREYTRMLIGPGLVAVERDEHKRQRKVMNPAFGHVKLKALFPMLKRHSQKVFPTSHRFMAHN